MKFFKYDKITVNILRVFAGLKKEKYAGDDYQGGHWETKEHRITNKFYSSFILRVSVPTAKRQR